MSGTAIYAIAAQEANEARTYYCKTLMVSPKLETVLDKQEFASCVYFLWPMEPDQSLFYTKLALANTLLGTVVGAVLRNDDRVLGALIGSTVALVIDFIVLLIALFVFV